jgi:hypothetical protein
VCKVASLSEGLIVNRAGLSYFKINFLEHSRDIFSYNFLAKFSRSRKTTLHTTAPRKAGKFSSPFFSKNILDKFLEGRKTTLHTTALQEF